MNSWYASPRRFFVGALLLPLCLIPFLIPVPPWIREDRFFLQVGLLYHFGLFAFMTMLLSRLLVFSHSTRFCKWLLMALMMSGLCFAVEWMQSHVGRSANALDAIVGSLGVMVATGRCSGRLPNTWMVVICCAMILPSALVLLDRVDARRSFPVLANFESRLQMGRWKTRSIEYQRVVFEGHHVAKVTLLNESAYAGMFMTDFRRDWRNASALIIRAYLVGDEPLDGWIRMDDHNREPTYKDRFQDEIRFHPGWNEIRIERENFAHTSNGRPMQLARIETWGIFFNRAGSGRVIYFDRTYLECGPL